MEQVLLLFQIIISIALVALVSIQGKGGGLGSAFGASYATYSKRRGVEKFVYQLTIVVVILFLIISIANLAL